MGSVSWIRSQDYYLRLGFLKVLVGALSSERQSVSNDVVLRRLRSPLLEPAERFDKLLHRVHFTMKGRRSGMTAGRQGSEASTRTPTVAEALLADGDCPSLLYAITPSQAQKILEWGHDVGLIGRANQITERGLLLKALLPTDRVTAFLLGDPDSWNPFVLTPSERAFFLYHLGELDRVIWEIARNVPPDADRRFMEPREISTITCRCIFKALSHAEKGLSPKSIIAYRSAKALACAIAEELALDEFRVECEEIAGRRHQVRRTVSRRSLAPPAVRHTTKKADHESIPRFEQLVDIGMLGKQMDVEGADSAIDARQKWKFTARDGAHVWRSRTAAISDWAGFSLMGYADVAIDALSIPRSDQPADWPQIVERVWRAYQVVKRPVGHTPFESVALVATIQAIADGVSLEIAAAHSLMLAVKTRSALPEHAFFASGNAVDRMFILLKNGFVEEAKKCLPHLELPPVGANLPPTR